ncbi:hypothetical protein [Niallia nealsonii]|uniref:IDEAL domain-containing protein n=1 Tax=Niallia nealsonii TaxID=115979 RepID=A0A2N0Z2Q1_9BACI|nr:hypothetical protein [Niallia nealsonii]PKG23780.1 hypothetical protein CWS01_09760 [Niallia nealsonii]
MNNNYVVLKSFQYLIECTCPSPEHTFMLEFDKGDTFIITDEKKYVDSLGWLVLVLIKNSSVYMYIDELEEFVEDKKICSIMDLELKINYLEYKVNETLDSMDEGNFSLYAKELSALKEVQDSVAVFG